MGIESLDPKKYKIRTIPDLPTGDLRRKIKKGVHLCDSDLSLADRCAARRQYRTLRLAMYAPQRSGYATNGMYQGCYGYDRDGAKEIIMLYYQRLSWMTYLGTK